MIRTVETMSGRIEYVDTGTGLPVLYFHGTGAASDAAVLLEQPLVDSGCRLIIPNRPGYGSTVRGPAGSADFCAQLASELLHTLSIERAAVIGTSGGGMPAMAFAEMFPEHTAALILQCAQTHPWTSGEWLPNGLGPWLFLFRHQLFRPLLRWQNSRHARHSDADPAWCLQQMAEDRSPEILTCGNAMNQIAALAAMTRQCAASPQGIENDWSMLVSSRELMPGAIATPVLLIHDRCDPLVPFRHAEWVHARTGNSQLLDIHAGGHLIWFGQDADLMHAARLEFIQAAITS